MIRKTALAVAAAFCFVAPALANDTTAVMGTGGLVLQRTDGIEMRSEDLYVSAREIRVQYRFFNRTDRDISTVVAFPMPDVTGGSESDMAVSFDDATQPTPFTTTVDGARAPTQVEQKAFLNGTDFTGELTANRIPLNPYRPETAAALNDLSRPVLARLVQQGLVEDRGWTEDNGVVHVELVALWTLKTTHYWTQVFPAGREIGIDHHYTPAIGGTVETLIGRSDLNGDAEARTYWESERVAYEARYCTDADFVGAARRQWASGMTLSEVWVDYVLTTGANWAAPIGEFRLVVDKGEPGNLVSFCAEGVRKIGPTTFEVRHTNYTPTRDLSVLILHGERLQR